MNSNDHNKMLAASNYELVYEESYGDLYKKFTEVLVDETEVLTIVYGNNILDIGVGTGRIAIQAAMRGAKVTGLDTDLCMLNVLEANAIQNNVIIVGVSSFDVLGVGDFDIACMYFTVVSYVTTEVELKEIFKNVFESLRSGGVFVFDVPDRSLFGSSTISTKKISRVIRSVFLGGDLYEYKESVKLKDSDVTYGINLTTRYWDCDEVKRLCESVGFVCDIDRSRELSKTLDFVASKYFVFEKP